MPLYVQRTFRVKAFGLLSAQLVCVFAEMALVEWAVKPQLCPWESFGKSVFYLVGGLTLGLVICLHHVRDWYPANYLLILGTTLSVGVFWGLSPMSSFSHWHYQLVGMLAVTMGVGAAMAGLLTRRGLDPRLVSVLCLLTGWVVASGLDLLVTQYGGTGSLDSVWVAMLTTFTLLSMVLMLDAGLLLVKCNPDDFARVIVMMDSALLVITMPVFVLSCCLLRSESEELAASDHSSEVARSDAAERVRAAPTEP